MCNTPRRLRARFVESPKHVQLQRTRCRGAGEAEFELFANILSRSNIALEGRSGDATPTSLPTNPLTSSDTTSSSTRVSAFILETDPKSSVASAGFAIRELLTITSLNHLIYQARHGRDGCRSLNSDVLGLTGSHELPLRSPTGKDAPPRWRLSCCPRCPRTPGTRPSPTCLSSEMLRPKLCVV